MPILDNFPHRCTIERRTRTRGDLGGTKDSVTSEQTNVECWEQRASERERTEYDKKGMTLSRKIYFKSDPSVTSRHNIKITSRDRGVTTISNPTVLEVRSEAAPDASAGLGVVYKVMVEEVTNLDP